MSLAWPPSLCLLSQADLQWEALFGFMPQGPHPPGPIAGMHYFPVAAPCATEEKGTGKQVVPTEWTIRKGGDKEWSQQMKGRIGIIIEKGCRPYSPLRGCKLALKQTCPPLSPKRC